MQLPMYSVSHYAKKMAQMQSHMQPYMILADSDVGHAVLHCAMQASSRKDRVSPLPVPDVDCMPPSAFAFQDPTHERSACPVAACTALHHALPRTQGINTAL